MTETPLRVGVLAYPGCFASELFGVIDLLRMGNHFAGPAPGRPGPFQTHVVSPRRRVTVSGAVTMDVRPMRELDILVVPGFELVPDEDLDGRLGALRAEIKTIRDVADSGTAIVSICVGAFLIGEAGILGGRAATTSWLFAPILAARYPDVQVRADDLVVTDSGVTSTAAFSAMFDFSLDLIQRHSGPRAARRTARVALVDDARTSQTPYVDDELLPTIGTSFSSHVQRHLDQHLKGRYSLRALAAAFHVSERTLLRRYKAETDETPLAYLQRSRIRRAQHLLETTNGTMHEIRATVGYRDPGSFASLFERHVGLSPGAYRAAFGRAAARTVTERVADR